MTAPSPPPAESPEPTEAIAPRMMTLRPRNSVVLMIGIAGGLLLADFARGMLADLHGILITLLICLFLALAMEPAVQYLHGRGVRRGVGTMLVFIGLLVAVAGFVAAMAPLIIDQVQNLIDNGPDVLDSLADQAQNLPGSFGQSISDWLLEQQSELPNRLPDLAGSLAGGVARAGSTVAGGILQLLTIALVTFYLVADGPQLRRVLLRRLNPARQREFLRTWELAIAKTGGYTYSRLLTAVASTAFHFVAFSIIDVPYPAALAMFVGIVSSVIPVIGTYLAGVLPLVIALADAPITALWVLIAIILYQQIENYLVAPKITAHTMELHPAVAFLSVLAGGALLGAVGALLALPAAAIATALVAANGERHELIEDAKVTAPDSAD
jgi:predicted PurR-regulated permease PerM